MQNMKYISEAITYHLYEEGLFRTLEMTNKIIRRSLGRRKRALFNKNKSEVKQNNSFFDVIFINGCDYSVPHPIRYRVTHQMEQLIAAGLSVSLVEAANVSNDLVRHASVFIIFRCPISDNTRTFIKLAKQMNKRVIYDIDDLVIDTQYTDAIPFVAQMSAEDRRLYDDGVNRMGETLELCDCAITTTRALADELKSFVPRVYINRNSASELMRHYSDQAVWRRDVLSKLEPSELEPHSEVMYKRSLERAQRRDCGEVRIGYFSGSITHNADFSLVLPVIKDLLQEYRNLKLVLSGEIDLPTELAPLSKQIIHVPFCDWKRLPALIADCDINIAPLEDSLFNRAKSENKWIEASLVKVPTVASNVGAFEEMIDDGVNGILCSTPGEWHEAIARLINDAVLRREIGENAYNYCVKNCTTVGNCQNLANIIKTEKPTNIAMVMPSLKTSGGVLVVFKHCAILQNAGYDVMLINSDDSVRWLECEGTRFPVLCRNVPSGRIDDCPFSGRIDKAVATLWDTLDFIKRYPRIGQSYYFVQNFETDFYLPGDQLRLSANSTYIDSGESTLITISRWCKDWLLQDFGKECRYAPNGIDCSQFYPIERDFSDSKVRILIEGDCGSEYKNVDESFYISNQLDSNHFEVWYMNYTGKTKSFYRIDRFLGAVPHENVSNIYRECHILLKTSLLESFSYPPLEMMATGGFVVALPNDGNSEFLVSGENCLMYSQGCYQEAIDAINRIVSDEKLRHTLYVNGIKTAQSRDWSSINRQICDLYK